MRRSSLLALLLVLVACGSAPPAPEAPVAQPVTLGPEGSETISFTKVIIRIPAGTKVGIVYVKKSEKNSTPIFWKTNLIFGDEEFRLSAIDEMQRYGYTVLGSDQILFEQAVKYKPRFLLGGVLTELVQNEYLKKAGDAISTKLTVEWQLYDTQQEKNVFRKTVKAEARKEKDHSLATVYLAFSRALDELLADKQFVALVSRKPGSPTSGGLAQSQAFINLKPCTGRALSLPNDLALAEQAIVVVKVPGGIGTGVVISTDGLVLTAGHVARGTKTAILEFHNGLALEAEVVRIADDADLALLKLAGTGHACLPLRTDVAALVGQEVYAIGTPRGLDFSVTKGILSAVRGEGVDQLLQTDAALNPGNSGGPILDRTAHVLAIVSFKPADKASEGLAFAASAAAVEEALKLSIR